MYNRSTRYQSRRRLSASLGMQFSPYKVNFDRVHSGKDFNQCGEETSECDEKADSGNCSEWRQGNRVTVSREDYNLRKQASTRKYYGEETSECDKEGEADENTSEYDQESEEGKQASTSEYDGKDTSDTSECNEQAEADDGNCSKWRRKHVTNNYYPKAYGKQGNRVTVSRDDYNLHESDQRTTNDYDRMEASTRKYYSEETSECDEDADADGNCSKRGRKQETKNYYPKADGKQGNRVTMTESKQVENSKV
jgi:hypothetical protein